MNRLARIRAGARRSTPPVHPGLRRLTVTVGVVLAASIAHADVPQRIDFVEHVQPILAEHCTHCHGRDAATR